MHKATRPVPRNTLAQAGSTHGARDELPGRRWWLDVETTDGLPAGLLVQARPDTVAVFLGDHRCLGVFDRAQLRGWLAASTVAATYRT